MLNSIHLIGRLGKDPELRYTSDKKPVANFSLAVDDPYNKDKDPQWFNVVVWGKPAEACKEFIGKGSLVFVGGRVETRNYDDKDGNKRYITEVIANRVRFLDKRKAPQENGSMPPPDVTADDDDLPF